MNIDIIEGEVYITKEHKGWICLPGTSKEHERGELDGGKKTPPYILNIFWVKQV